MFWVTEGYLISVIVGGFTSAKAASDYGAKGGKRITCGETPDHLLLIDEEENEHQLSFRPVVVGQTKNIRVSKPREGNSLKGNLNPADLVNVDVESELPQIMEAINQRFDVLIYGVRDSNGQLICP